ncbi:hypothetical protein ISS07_07030 [Candidatus Woesearchaeota archaeon]|nr:hypothetical protein [Candidatus Woesearchaeota archaeon]
MMCMMKLKEYFTTGEGLLRIGIFGSFLGHGIFALGAKASWIPYFQAVGLSESNAISLMPLIGAMDIIVAFLALFYPIRIVLAWAGIWGLWTALLRPIAGQPIWDFVERWANWAAPVALLALQGWTRRLADWIRVRDNDVIITPVKKAKKKTNK